MTAEIAILNKHAVALAADSAVTLGTGKKIYNSADKLFALSKYCPVGIMVHGCANFLETPWEPLVKEYRRSSLKDRSFGTLAEYANDFIKFLRTTRLISSEAEERFVHRIVGTTVADIKGQVSRRVRGTIEQQGSITRGDTIAIVREVLNSELERLGKQPFMDGASARQVASFERRAAFRKFFSDATGRVLERIPLSASDERTLWRLCALSVFKKRFTHGGKAGIVVAGYGKDELFPAIESYALEGRFRGVLRHERDSAKSERITLRSSAIITAFAQSDMVSTFMNGLHPDQHNLFGMLLTTLFEELPGLLEKRFGGISESTGSMRQLHDDFRRFLQAMREEVDGFSRKEFVSPVLDTVSALPKDELAKMAEALVSLTSFRRKVTPHAETVGGPIDVLVISKGDGLVWIKRKHYFEKALNHQFFDNYYRD